MPDLIERAHADGARWSAHARVDKFAIESIEQCRFDLGLDREPNGPELLDWAERTRGARAGDEVIEVDGNTATRLGRHRLWDRYIGTASNQALDATHMRIGVGDSNTTAADTDTDLGAAAGSSHRQFNLVNSVATIGAAGSSGVLTAVATFATTDANFHWQEWCADPDTQILTRDGWRSYDEIDAGVEVLTLDPATLLSRWEPLLGVAIWPERTRSLLHIKGGYHDSLTTLDHRWLSVERAGRTRTLTPRWRTSATLNAESRIPIAAPHEGLPEMAKYTDAFVELVAWYWTEGWFTRRDRPGWSGGIGQSMAVNPGYVARIRRALLASFGGSGWDEGPRAGGMVHFYLGDAVMRALEDVAPGKVPSFSFLQTLTQAQLGLLIRTCVDDDGVRDGRSGQEHWLQVSDAGVSAFEMACALAGIATHTYRAPSDACRFGRDPWLVSMLRRSSVRPARLSREVEVHDGLVWCPQTPSTTWLARRNGTVFFTGNCIDGGTGAGTTVTTDGNTTPGLQNHKVTDLGTKTSAASWIFTVSLTIT